MKIYIDIDGVLLNKDGSLPVFGIELISYLVTNHECFWLSTHCRGGKNKAIDYLSAYYPDSILKKLSGIKATEWTDLKTEGIDLDAAFLWLEDYPMEAEKILLQDMGKLDSLIHVDLNRPDELKSVYEKIKQLNNN